MANANDRDCRDYVPLLTAPQIPTDGTGSTAELHDEIVKFCYSYIDNFRCCMDGKKKVVALKAELEKIKEELQALGGMTGLYADDMTIIEVAVRAPIIAYEYSRYLQEHGIPDDGIFEAELLAKYLQEKADLGIVE
jgi:hypothetical protein